MEIIARERGKTKIGNPPPNILPRSTKALKTAFPRKPKLSRERYCEAEIPPATPFRLETGTEAEIEGMRRVGIRRELEAITGINAVIPIEIIAEARSD